MVAELIIRYLKFGIGLVILWFLLWIYGLYGCHKMEGSEMAPTIESDVYKITDVRSRHPDQLDREQMVAFHYEQLGEKQNAYVGRVIGLPGDRVRIKNGAVFVNDREISSNYVDQKSQDGRSMPEVIVPRDHIFLLCDNRLNFRKNDSRGIGPVHYLAIEGTVE